LRDFRGFFRDNDNISVIEIENTPMEKINGENGYSELKELSNNVIWVLDPFKMDNDINDSDFEEFLNELGIESVDSLLDMLNEYKTASEMNLAYRRHIIKNKNFHSTMICLYSGLSSNFTGEVESYHLYNRYYCHYPHIPYARVRAGWLHTGDAELRKLSDTDFFKYYKNYIPNIGVMQIPHHGSRKNHDSSLIKMFNNLEKKILYFTHSISGGHAKPNVVDINAPIHPVSEYNFTKIIIEYEIYF